MPHLRDGERVALDHGVDGGVLNILPGQELAEELFLCHEAVLERLVNILMENRPAQSHQLAHMLRG